MSAIDIALRYNAETGRPLFSCLPSKKPATPHGFHDAASDASALRDLWRRYPGPLIGMPTGAASGVAVLDIDAVKHPAAARWFEEHRDRLMPTLTIETRSGGWHCYYRQPPGLRGTVKLFGVEGVDIRADGGYVIGWGLHGGRTLMRAELAPWPAWLTPPRPKRADTASAPPRVPDDSSIGRLIRFVANATEGERNSRAYWAGRRLREMCDAGTLGRAEATAIIVAAAQQAGLPEIEAKRTARSAIERAAS